MSPGPAMPAGASPAGAPGRDLPPSQVRGAGPSGSEPAAGPSGSVAAAGSVPSPALPLDPTPALLDEEVVPVRKAVSHHLSSRSPGDVVVVAVSGGADSLALAALAHAVAPLHALRVGAVVVDHALQPGSAAVAEEAASTCRRMGMDPVQVVDAHVDTDSGLGLEGAARTARYAALRSAASAVGAAEVLLAHTRDDQAETVLLGLARGSGARSLAGMSPRDGLWGRPLLGIARAQAHAALARMLPDVTPWDDPANLDPRFLRARVRHELMPMLEDVLGRAAVEALARSADLMRSDDIALEVWAQIGWDAAAVIDGVHAADAGELGLGIHRQVVLAVGPLEALPDAVRRRVVRRALLVAGARPGSVTSDHIGAVDGLIVDWRGRGPVALPGRITAARSAAALRVSVHG